MASISNKDGRVMIQFVIGDGSRKTIRLGRLNKKQANRFCENLESLISSQTAHVPVDDEINRWRAGLPDKIYAKLVGWGMADAKVFEPIENADAGFTLKEFVDGFIERQAAVKVNTKENWTQVKKWLLKFFAPEKDIRTISRADAEDFRAFMLKEGLSENTIRRHTGRCRQIFTSAIDRDVVVGKNPFVGKTLPTRVRGNKGRKFFVTRDMYAKLVDACTSSQWKAMVAMSRIGGVRVPSEITPLKWADINWEHNRILIHSPKTEHHEGGDSRWIPLFPELRQPLLDVFEEAEQGEEFVFTRFREKYANLRTQMLRYIKKAGLTVWQKPFHNMRSSRQTELNQKYPAHVVAAWMGNSEKVADEHYNQVLDSNFEDAARDEKALQSAADSDGQERTCAAPDVQESPENPGNQAKLVTTLYPRQDSNL